MTVRLARSSQMANQVSSGGGHDPAEVGHHGPPDVRGHPRRGDLPELGGGEGNGDHGLPHVQQEREARLHLLPGVAGAGLCK